MGSFSVWSCLFGVVCVSCIYIGMSFLNLGEVSFYVLFEDLVSAIDLGFFSFIYAYNLKIWSFPWSHIVLVGFFSVLYFYFLILFFQWSNSSTLSSNPADLDALYEVFPLVFKVGIKIFNSTPVSPWVLTNISIYLLNSVSKSYHFLSDFIQPYVCIFLDITQAFIVIL